MITVIKFPKAIILITISTAHKARDSELGKLQTIEVIILLAVKRN